MTDGRRNVQTWLFNPYHYVAGWQALVAGLFVILLSGSIASRSNSHFCGLLDFQLGSSFPLWVFLVEGLINWLVMALLIYIGGRIISASRIRVLDVLGTQALARFPGLISAAMMCWFQPAFLRYALKAADSPIVLPDLAAYAVTLLVVILMVVWMVALMYRAFAVSCNVKGGKAIATFIGAVLLGETITRIALMKLYPVAQTATLAALMLVSGKTAEAASPAPKMKVEGVWMGALQAGSQKLRVVLKFFQNDGHQILCTIDSPDQGAREIPVQKLVFTDSFVHLEAKTIGGTFDGSFMDGGRELKGTWMQGLPLPLTLEKLGPRPWSAEDAKKNSLVKSPANAGNLIAGNWNGLLDKGYAKIRLIYRIRRNQAGKLDSDHDSPDQSVYNIKVDHTTFENGVLYLDDGATHSTYEGKMDSTGKNIRGFLNESGFKWPLVLQKK